MVSRMWLSRFFFNDTATTEIYTLSLHDALPISQRHLERIDPGGAQVEMCVLGAPRLGSGEVVAPRPLVGERTGEKDRKSTRLNSSHANISYAVFCLQTKSHRCRQAQHRRWLLPA